MKILPATISSALIALSATSVFAESPDAKASQEFFQSWQLDCVEQAEIKSCSVKQELKTDKGQTAAVVNLSNVDKETVLEFALPLMMDLTKPVSISVDGGSASNYSYNACNSRACFVILKDNKDVLASFKKGKEAQLKAVSFGGQNIEMNISLNGFGTAYSELLKR